MEDNVIFEWMIHGMELSIVLGIGIVVWWVRSSQSSSSSQSLSADGYKKNVNENSTVASADADIGSHKSPR